jgi:hypothetical protein
MLSSRAFGLNDFACEWQALAALNLATETLISTFGMGRTCTHGITYLVFTQRIADADNHRLLLLRIN